MRTLLIALALFATAASAEETERPLDANPDWIKKPDMDDLRAVWPREALQKGISGKAVLSCQISPQGTLEGCRVIEESPVGMGFGGAALLLAPSFALKPGIRDGKPVSTTARIPITFKVPSPIDGTSLERAPMVTDAVWEQAPSFADMAAAWPDKATAEFAHVSMRCRIKPDGTLEYCDVLTETPRGQGFGKAARTVVAPRFKMRMAPEVADEVAKASVNLPVRFLNPAKATTRSIVKPQWITQPDPQKVMEIYPDAAVKAGVKSGRGVADCLVAPGGGLTDCKPAPATPEGLGFSEAAVHIASVMRMNPWSDGGGPVDGVRIKLPITFNLALDDQAAAASSAVTYLKDIVWVRKPSGADMARVVPARGISEGVNGRIILDCAVLPNGRVQDCLVAEEEPTGYGYGEAALALAPKFALAPGPPAGARVKIPVQIIAGGD